MHIIPLRREALRLVKRTCPLHEKKKNQILTEKGISIGVHSYGTVWNRSFCMKKSIPGKVLINGQANLSATAALPP
jgi:hypothetical protein